VVLRHGTAEPFAPTDQERHLADRGRDEARVAGERLRSLGVVPDHVVVTPAVRTRETWQEVASVLGSELQPVVERSGYGASLEVLVDALRTLPADAATVLFVGHNPVAAHLCHFLDDGSGDPAASAGLMQGLPTGALAVLETDVAWSDLDAECAQVVAFAHPDAR
jgi:phosphohistidine phosphatase